MQSNAITLVTSSLLKLCLNIYVRNFPLLFPNFAQYYIVFAQMLHKFIFTTEPALFEPLILEYLDIRTFTRMIFQSPCFSRLILYSLNHSLF